MKHFAAYVPIDRQRAMEQRQPLPDRSAGTAVTAKLTGFDQMLEGEAHHSPAHNGADTLFHAINNFFNELIHQVHQFGGSIINLSADTMTCWFNQDDGHRAAACGLAMIKLMDQAPGISTPDGQTINFCLKAAAVYGEIRRFQVGDPSIQIFDILAGNTVTRLMRAVTLAKNNELYVSQEILNHLGESAVAGRPEKDSVGEPFFGLISFTRESMVGLLSETPPALSDAELRAWILPPVYARFLTRQGSFTADFRPVSTLSIYFEGLDLETDPEVGRKLDQFIRWVQNTVNKYEGFLLNIGIEGEGGYLCAALGAPISHGDDPLRAVMAALDLKDRPDFLTYIQILKIGVGHGPALTGDFGAHNRKSYAVVGHPVNESKRLARQAKPGQILINETVLNRVKQRIRWRTVGNLKLKKNQDVLPAWEVLETRRPTDIRPGLNRPLLGRKTEFTLADQLLQQTVGKRGQLLHIEGASGIGKTHLAQAVIYQAETIYQFRTIHSVCHADSQTTLYAPWRPIIRQLLTLDPGVDPHQPEGAAQQLKTLNRILGRINPKWRLRLPLLAAMLGLPAEENPTVTALSPRQRQEALHTLLIDIIGGHALNRPLLIYFDDVHWIDEGSAALIADLARTTIHRPLMLMLIQQPPREDGIRLHGLDELPHFQKVYLTELASKHIETITERHIDGRLSDLAKQIIAKKALGNPFFAEETVKLMVEEGQLVKDEEVDLWQPSSQLLELLEQGGTLEKIDGGWRLHPENFRERSALELPNEIDEIILARLTNCPKKEAHTLQVASVIGRSFDFDILQQILPEKPEVPELMNRLSGDEKNDFIQLESIDPNLTYIFRHETVQSVAYEMLPAGLREDLHRTLAEQLELKFSADADAAPHFPLLAYHWRYGRNAEKEFEYLRQAARQAAGKFAHQDAQLFWSRCLKLGPASDPEIRFELLLKRQKLFGQVEFREEQSQDLEELENLLSRGLSIDYVIDYLIAKADFCQATGRLKAALEAASSVVELSLRHGKAATQIEGLLRIGIAQWHMGDFAPATATLRKGLSIGESTLDFDQRATILRNLGIIAGIENKHSQAEQFFQQALAVDRAQNNKIGEDATLANLAGIYFQIGDLARCRKMTAGSLALNREMGLRHGETTALINLGSVLHALGELHKAAKLFTEAVEVAGQINDPARESMANYNLALVLIDQNFPDQARRAAERAAFIDRKLEDKLSLSYSLYAQGLALITQEEFAEAVPLFSKSAAIRHQVGLYENRIDCLAAQAIALLNLDDLDGALGLINIIIEWLDLRGEEGLENPARVYTAIVSTLLHAKRFADAEEWLMRGQSYIQRRSRLISDPAAREGFLYLTPSNRELINFDLDGFSQNHAAD